MKKYQESFQEGNDCIRKRDTLNLQKNEFLEQSRSFFNQIELFDEINSQCNMENCKKSIDICRIFSDEFLDKIGMPKKMAIPKKKNDFRS